MYLYGASGHGKVLAEIAEESNIKIDAFIDSNLSKKKLLDYKVIHEIPHYDIDIIISIGNNIVRKGIAEELKNFNFKKLLHPKAIISKRAKIEEGTVIMAGVTINSEVKIGRHCIINKMLQSIMIVY